MKRIQGKRAKKQSVQKSSIDSSQCCQPSVCSAKLKQCAISHAIRTAAKDLRRCIGGVKKPKRQVCCAHRKKKEILHAVREFQNGKHMVHKRGNDTAFLLLQNAEVHTNNSWVGNMQQTAAIAFGHCCVL